jgi:hypothetical protein
VGFDIQQDRDKGTVTLSMPRYIYGAAERFGVDTSVKVDARRVIWSRGSKTLHPTLALEHT